MIRSFSPVCDSEFEGLLAQTRLYLLAIANDELPLALRAKGGASDLVQETLTAAWRHRSQFRGTSVTELRLWLRAILQNELAQFHRRFVATASREITREVPLDPQDEYPDSRPALIDSVVQQEQAETLAVRVSALPHDSQLVMSLRLDQGLPFDLIGERLGRSEDAARKLFARALDRLRDATPSSD